MEKTMCQKCFHYEACCAIDLSGALGNPESENMECEHFIDAERVKIQDKAYWKERVHQYRTGEMSITYYCSHCNNMERVKMYNQKEWDEYYSEHYLETVELPDFCKKCGAIVEDIVRAD